MSLLVGAVLAGPSLRSMGEERELAVFDDRGATVPGFPVGIVPWSPLALGRERVSRRAVARRSVP
jgi:hypothetical protein